MPCCEVRTISHDAVFACQQILHAGPQFLLPSSNGRTLQRFCSLSVLFLLRRKLATGLMSMQCMHCFSVSMGSKDAAPPALLTPADAAAAAAPASDMPSLLSCADSALRFRLSSIAPLQSLQAAQGTGIRHHGLPAAPRM